MIMKRLCAPALGLALFLLAACSGEERGDGGDRPVAAEISSTNALLVASTTLAALAGAGDIGAVDQLLGDLGKRSPGFAAMKADSSAPGPGQHLCRPGKVGGTLAPANQGQLQRQQHLVPGDRFSLEFADCRLNAGLRLSGGLDVRVERFVGAPNSSDLEYLYTSTFRELRIDAASANYVANGDMRMFFGSTNFPLVFAALSGRHLTIQTSDESATLRDYELASQGVLQEKPDVFGSVDTIFDGLLSSSEFAGEIRFQTQVPFRTDDQTLAKPARGQLEIFGARGAVLRLTVAGPAVELALDADGDGRYEHRERSTWAALTGSS